MSKKALVTGSAGFVGRYMVRELQAREWKVFGWDIKEGNKVFGWDIKEGNDALEAFRIDDPPHYDLIVHAAYHVGGRAAIDDPSNLNFAKNLELDAAMFQWAVRTGQGRVLYFSSSAVYPTYLQSRRSDGNQAQLFEDDVDLYSPEPPDANYGWAKLTGERLARDARAAGLKVTVVRPFSGYGADQDPLEYPFPAIVQRAAKGDLSVWGPPGQCRDWIHVSDVVKGALAVVESGTEKPVNLCTGIATEMGDLALEIARRARIGDSFTYPGVKSDAKAIYLLNKPTGVFYRVGNPDLMLRYYTPQITLEQGIDEALGHLKMI